MQIKIKSKNQTETLGLKKAITKTKNYIESFSSRLDQTEK
jgi:hypothetical protein